jgi:lysophospholipase L1-like esterase
MNVESLKRGIFAVILAASLVACTSHPTIQPATPPAKIRIALAGDSTVTDTAGWGAAFAKLLSPNVELINLSKGGRSSKSFIAEGRWKECLALKPDYVLIQFGHNDQPGHPGDRETDPGTTYKQFMTQYVDDARAAGVKPVLVTSLSRRQWGSDGKIHSTLAPYVEVVKQIAKEKEVPLVDLHAASIELYNQMGKAEWDKISPTKKDSTDLDNTHLTPAGAAMIAPLVADGLRKAVLALAPYLKQAS